MKEKYNGLFYEIKGKGQPIIFLHGIGGTHAMFFPQVQVFSQIAETITVDLKGHGNSESIKTMRCLDVHCQSILDLMTHLNLEKAIFVGLSYGGIVTQNFAIKYPDKVERMVLIDTYSHILPRTLSQISLTFLGLFITTSALIPYKMLTPFFKQYEKWELAYETIRYNYKTRKKLQMMLQLIELFGKSYLKEIKKLHTPTLVIVGDAIPSIVEKSFEIYENKPNAEICIIKDAMDPSNLCAPVEVNNAIAAFVQLEE